MDSLILATLLVGLSCYRAWRIVGKDTITEPLREPLLARDDKQPWHWFNDLITCPWCLGFWFCGVGALIMGNLYEWRVIEGLFVWLGASSVCGLLGKLDD